LGSREPSRAASTAGLGPSGFDPSRGHLFHVLFNAPSMLPSEHRLTYANGREARVLDIVDGVIDYEENPKNPFIGQVVSIKADRDVRRTWREGWRILRYRTLPPMQPALNSSRSPKSPCVTAQASRREAHR
jgi:hypothetical protein